eukprot:scaffold94865_cov67-Phaeocystis_antarctica.AAC.1
MRRLPRPRPPAAAQALFALVPHTPSCPPPSPRKTGESLLGVHPPFCDVGTTGCSCVVVLIGLVHRAVDDGGGSWRRRFPISAPRSSRARVNSRGTSVRVMLGATATWEKRRRLGFGALSPAKLA